MEFNPCRAPQERIPRMQAPPSPIPGIPAGTAPAPVPALRPPGAGLANLLSVVGWVVLVIGTVGVLYLLDKVDSGGGLVDGSDFVTTAQVAIMVPYESIVVLAWAVCVGLGFVVGHLVRKTA
jgi:hypothetical protein